MLEALSKVRQAMILSDLFVRCMGQRSGKQTPKKRPPGTDFRYESNARPGTGGDSLHSS